MASFVHLHVHTEYSIVDSLVRTDALIETLKEQQSPAVAVTDQMNLFVMVKFFQQALAEGIKPIMGADLNIAAEDGSTASKMVVLCQNETGYHHLCQLLTLGYLHGQQSGIPVLKPEWVSAHSPGLIGLSGAMEGDIGRALAVDDLDLAQRRLEYWHKAFAGQFYLELTRIGQSGEQHYNQLATKLAQQNQVPVVATNNVRFIDQQDFEAHEARICIHTGRVLPDTSRPRDYTDQQYLRNPQQMRTLFRDIPEAVDNTVAIAKRCNFIPPLGQYHLPQFPIPPGYEVQSYLKQQAEQGLERRLQQDFGGHSQQYEQLWQNYYQRLNHELEIINKMGFPGYFLIVADFIYWAKVQHIPVGPGRGSGAGSLVAYALGITNLDPIRWDLLFERFLNPERVSMPDFDVDFCMENRDRVIEYVSDKYGRDNVSQIITYGTMAARAVVRDVGRVLGHPYGYVDKIAKLIPFEVGMTLQKALEHEDLAERYRNEEEVATLLNLAIKLEGITRNAGKHAGGVVIAPSPLTDFAPLYREPDDEGVVTQFDKDDVEAIGLVKFDFLGLRTLTIINWACQQVNARRDEQDQAPIDIEQIPLDDGSTFALLKRCETTAVFQLESRGMKDLIRRLQPDNFNEIIALVALFRPGPLQSGMVEDFIDRKHGRAQVTYPHPWLASILSPTYGVILYQEQVMQIAQTLAGYTLGSADLLRRAMGKKKQKEMAKQRSIFLEGAKERGIDQDTATYIFDLIEKFAGYGFNKSHSAAYALLAYQTAWLKTHYPAEFMAAVLSSDMDNTDKVVTLVDECRRMDLEVLVPDINRSGHRFSVDGLGRIVYGLGAIKGVGDAAIESLLAERKINGPYQNLFELCRRVDLRKINRRVLEALVTAGALDDFGVARAQLMYTLEKALKKAEQHKANEAVGQNDLFAEPAMSGSEPQESYDNCPEWSEKIRLGYEKNVLGFYLSGHPITDYCNELAHWQINRLADIQGETAYTVRVAGLITQARTLTTKRGDKMAVVQIDDGSTQMEMVVFSSLFHDKRYLLGQDQLIIVDVDAQHDDYRGGIKLIAQDLMDIIAIRERTIQAIEIVYNSDHNDLCDRLKIILQSYRGGKCPVHIKYQSPEAHALVQLEPQWAVIPQDELFEELAQLQVAIKTKWIC
jgi:DNA polymerase-3 subunit alpha